MGEWRKINLEYLAAPTKNALATGPFGSAISSKFFRDSGVPVIRGSNLSVDVGVRLDESEYAFISEEKAGEFSRSIVRAGDLVFTCWGTIGQVGIIPEQSAFEEYVISNKQMKFSPNSEVIDGLYLYYYLSSPSPQAYLQGVSIGSSVPGFNLGQLRKFPVLVPDLIDQQAISSLLGALDDKISLNNKILVKSDRVIRALYAKAGEQADSTIPLGMLAREVRELTQPSELTADDKYVGLDVIPRRNLWLQKSQPADSVISTKSKFAVGDVLFGKLRPYFHKVVSASFEGICSTDVIVARSQEEALRGFFLAAASSDEIIEHATIMSEGTRMPRTKWKDLARFEVPWPGQNFALSLSSEIVSLEKLALSLIRENNHISGLRDTLLPQLMDGTLTVRVAEELISDAV